MAVGQGKRIGGAVGAAIGAVAARDVLQRRHAILRNFPVIGHGRYLIESIGPELRQYIVAGNDEERPFSRDQRRWVYASSKGQINTFGFGTDNDMEDVDNLLVFKHTPFPEHPPQEGTTGSAPEYLVPAGKVLGAAHGRRHAFRPQSIVNFSGMSYGSLSPPAVEALNRGAAVAPCLHNIGEGGLAPAHLHGGELIFQIGSGYFGCRGEDGRLDLDRLCERVAEGPVRAIEFKLSQGAKPGLGGMLPGHKVTPEIARIRGVPEGKDCISPPRHTAFADVDELIELIETIADRTGLPVGVKSAVGEMGFWHHLAARMKATGGGPDFITIDGAEGGTGAAPLTFADHVAMPFKIGFSRAYQAFLEEDLTEEVVFIGAGRLGVPDSALFAFALGADMVNVGREAMLSIGCIQAQKCHTDTCPTGVATQKPWLEHGLDPELKSVRAANYIRTLRRDLLKVAEACGAAHPGLVDADDVEILFAQRDAIPLRELVGYEPGWGSVGAALREEAVRLMEDQPQGGSAEASATSRG